MVEITQLSTHENVSETTSLSDGFPFTQLHTDHVRVCVVDKFNKKVYG